LAGDAPSCDALLLRRGKGKAEGRAGEGRGEGRNGGEGRDGGEGTEGKREGMRPPHLFNPTLITG